MDRPIMGSPGHPLGHDDGGRTHRVKVRPAPPRFALRPRRLPHRPNLLKHWARQRIQPFTGRCVRLDLADSAAVGCLRPAHLTIHLRLEDHTMNAAPPRPGRLASMMALGILTVALASCAKQGTESQTSSSSPPPAESTATPAPAPTLSDANI